MSSPVRGPKIGPSIAQLHNALVEGFNGFQLSVIDPRTKKPKFLTASNTVTSSVSGGVFPHLAFRTGSFTLSPWKDFMYSITWDVPARLTVQGPADDGEESMRAILLDILLRTNELIGLPLDEKGKVVPFSDETVRRFDRGEIDFLCERGAPMIKSVSVNGLDDGLCTADIIFRIESTIDLDPRTLKLMKVGVLGVNPVQAGGLYQDTTATDGRGIAMVFAETGFGGYDSQDPYLGHTIRDPLQHGGTSQATGLAPNEIITGINVTPYSGSLSVGSPTLQLSAIAFAANASSIYVTSSAAWTSSDAAVATVSSSGLVTRVAAGSCTVSCVYSGVTSNSVAITAT